MTDQTTQESGASTERANREAKLQALRQLGLDPYNAAKFPKSHKNQAVHEAYAHLQADERTEDAVAVAGRVMAIRNSGMFIDILDDTVKLQVYTPKDQVQGEFAPIMKALDLGDIIGVEGKVRRTKRGEITVDLSRIVVLAKALEPPPEKWHGLKNVEQRYRHREYDLIGNEDSRRTLRTRFRVIQAVRQFLTAPAQDFLEVETPMLHSIAGGAIAKPFVTHHNALDIPLYMRIAPELHLKRLVIGGLSEKVFEINRCFRNEGISPRHNPEFTTIELYQAYADYADMMDIAERIIEAAAIAATGGTDVSFGEHTISFKRPFRRATMLELIQEHSGFDLNLEADQAKARQALGAEAPKSADWGKLVEACFEHFVEPKLIQPTHVVELPKAISPLAKANPARPEVAERFETFCNGWEIANAFSELADPQEQRRRFEAQQEQRDAGDDEAHQVDEDFLKAQAAGMMPMGGLGVGIDRLVMLLTNSPTIREVIAFPTLRPRQHGEAASEGNAEGDES
ncbi:lysine--tRNA ligase [Ferrovibrio sp.]|uniref:lysine--tRNA ligase n=1 Tax=Ferrovibrio sp. TaxID=1917215 RepID=UPI001B7CC0AF|nr:lysine--tRNA ligase [Ferrovibrio sp.]MBP7064676.1 lysine--tRNA ligase [Ferrovibrio sp.]